MDEHDMAGKTMVEQVMNEQDMNKQPEPQPQPQRKKRRIYSLKKKNRKQLNGVTFDAHGFAIGDDQSPFALYIGAVTKAKISILITTTFTTLPSDNSMPSRATCHWGYQSRATCHPG
ncbi:hypothetical protein Tco_1061711 [Tanacetum coccineum]